MKVKKKTKDNDKWLKNLFLVWIGILVKDISRWYKYEGLSKSSKCHPDFKFVIHLLHLYDFHLCRN